MDYLPSGLTKEQKILQILQLLHRQAMEENPKYDNKNQQDKLPWLKCLEKYIEEYKAGRTNFSWKTFTYCCGQSGGASAQDVPKAMYLLKAFMKKFFKSKEWKGEPFKLEVPNRSGYHIKLIRNEKAKKKTKKPLLIRPTEWSKALKLLTLNHLKIGVEKVYFNTFHTIIEGFFKPWGLTKKAQLLNFPRPDALFLFIASIYISTNKVLDEIRSIQYTHPQAEANKEAFTSLLENIEARIDGLLSIYGLSSVVLGLIFLPTVVITFYGFIKGESFKQFVETIKTPRVHASALTLIMYGASFLIFTYTMLKITAISFKTFLAVNLSIGPAEFLIVLLTNFNSLLGYLEASLPVNLTVDLAKLLVGGPALYLFSVYMLLAYTHAFNTLMGLSKISSRMLISFMMLLIITLDSGIFLYVPHWLVTIPVVCFISMTAIRSMSRKYPALPQN